MNQPTDFSANTVSRTTDILDHTRRNAVVSTIVITSIAGLIALIGWRCFEFDPALLVYAQALLAALALTVYRFSIWVHRPPTQLLYQQAWNAWRSPGTHRFALLARAFNYFALNRFVWKRGAYRWAAHWPIMLGCVMAFAIVIPLIFGWVWFETPANDFHSYKVMLFGFHLRTIPVDGVEAFLAFHGLVWASFPVIGGVSVALWRRMRDRGDQATQTFGNDIAPLLILLAIAVTGLLMTISYSFLGGAFHAPLAKLHCLIVVGTLLWLPFSKLFHIPQRSLKLAHMIYEQRANAGEKAHCSRCGDAFASKAQIEDLIEVQQRLGYRYEIRQDNEDNSRDGADHYQWICPRCRRATLVLAQSSRWSQRAVSSESALSTTALSETNG